MNKFWIVTPAYRAASWISGCIASVLAQAGPGVVVHHHVQDGGSDDGTVERLRSHAAKVNDSEWQAEHPHYSFSWLSQKDEGMYDAINHGWDRATPDVDWLGHLNADEQYQLGALQEVALLASKHPRWKAITGNCIWVDEKGRYLCSRKPSVGWPWVGRVWIPAFTCAFFFQSRFYGPDKVRFDTSWKSFGDKVFCRALMQAGCRFGYVDTYLATFMHRGEANLGFQPITEEERSRYKRDVMSAGERRWAPLAIGVARMSRVWRRAFGRRCRSYTWFEPDGTRQVRCVAHHRWRWTGA
jgi:glycosyltransferase involved in cell wall biosynthesis